jgi:hypothetical protein
MHSRELGALVTHLALGWLRDHPDLMGSYYGPDWRPNHSRRIQRQSMVCAGRRSRSPTRSVMIPRCVASCSAAVVLRSDKSGRNPRKQVLIPKS